MSATIRPLLLRCLFTVVLAMSAAGPAAAQGQVPTPPSGGSEVGFASRDEAGNSVPLRGHLYTPAGAPKGAVVLVHGSGGWSDHREGHYGRAFREAGYAALAIDAFGPRGIGQTTEDQSQLTALQMTRDAFAARRHLIAQGLPPERIAVMGFSKGGVVALLAADRNFLPEETERFAASIPFYPGCMVRSRVPKPASAMFMALGEKDDYTGIKPCQEVAGDYQAAGGSVTVKIYPDAAHAFDGNPANTAIFRLRFAENYMDCVAYKEEDGQMSYGGKRYAPEDKALIADLRSTCMKKGASLWTNQRQKEAATRDVIAFLDQTLGR